MLGEILSGLAIYGAMTCVALSPELLSTEGRGRNEYEYRNKHINEYLGIGRKGGGYR